MKRRRTPLIVPVPTQSELLRRHSPVARASYRRGNAAGIHGGRKPRYGKTERQAACREARAADFQI